MDRGIVYPGAIPLDTDLLNQNRWNMIGLGFLAQAAFGALPIVDGFSVTQTTVPSMVINIAPGMIVSSQVLDNTAYGSLALDTTTALVKAGINTTTTQLTLTAPGTAGQSQNYLVQVSFSETDGGSTVLPYYNAATPSLPFSGPAGAGTSQNTQRIQRAVVSLKAGVAAVTGTQTTPAVDAGNTALYAITVANGQTTITTANLASGNPFVNALVPTAPFIQQKLGSIARMPTFSSLSTGNFIAPAGVYSARLRIWGGGGGAGGTLGAGSSGSAGGGGEYREGIVALTPGTVYAVTKGAGGAGGAAGGANNGTVGADSVFGALMTSKGGGLGTGANAVIAGSPGAGGTGGSGGTLIIPGGQGGTGNLIGGSVFNGIGGWSFGGSVGTTGASTVLTNGAVGVGPGCGGTGGIIGGSGGTGGAGLVLIEY